MAIVLIRSSTDPIDSPSTEDLVEKIEDLHAGESVELTVNREGQTATVSVKLAERPATSAG